MAVGKVYGVVYRGFGFKKGYNFPLYVITVGSLLGFIPARAMYLDFQGIFYKSAIPGEVYWYQKGHRFYGIRLHLVGVIVGGFLAILQFTPIIRHRLLWLHRICGYVAITALVIGNVGAFMILDHAVGGSPSMQVFFGLLGSGVTAALLIAYISIKRLKIAQHRTWMIRAWVWASSIISLRLILLAAQEVYTTYDFAVYMPISCEEVWFMYSYVAGIPDNGNPTPFLYPQCGMDASNNPIQIAITSAGAGPENAAALLRANFEMAAWLALSIHVFLTELYLWLTPGESRRLQVVSHERRVARMLR